VINLNCFWSTKQSVHGQSERCPLGLLKKPRLVQPLPTLSFKFYSSLPCVPHTSLIANSHVGGFK
jgi:hypothetical protein